MTSLYRRKTLRRRFWSFCDDYQWKIQTYGKWVFGGFMLGVLSMVIVAEIVWKL